MGDQLYKAFCKSHPDLTEWMALIIKIIIFVTFQTKSFCTKSSKLFIFFCCENAYISVILSGPSKKKTLIWSLPWV